jgi:hypothetical protein
LPQPWGYPQIDVPTATVAALEYINPKYTVHPIPLNASVEIYAPHPGIPSADGVVFGSQYNA